MQPRMEVLYVLYCRKRQKFQTNLKEALFLLLALKCVHKPFSREVTVA